MKDKRFPLRAIGYTRTSTRHQADGLERQAAAIRTFAKQFGIDVRMIFADEGVTGMTPKKAAERPDLRGALLMARQLSCPLIMVDATRLTRMPAVVRTLWSEFDANVLSIKDASILTPRMILERVRAGHRQGVAIREGTRRAVQGRPSSVHSAASEEARRSGGRRGSINNAVRAGDLVNVIADIIVEVDPKGCLSKKQVAVVLNGRGVLTPRGKSWDEENVRRHLEKARAKIELDSNLNVDDADW